MDSRRRTGSSGNRPRLRDLGLGGRRRAAGASVSVAASSRPSNNGRVARGLGEVSVRSNVIRAESHPFYERLGYVRFKTQHAYRKRILPH